MNKLGVGAAFFCALLFAHLAIAALASAQCPQDIVAELKGCASIGATAERLACFNQLAERAASTTGAPSGLAGTAASRAEPPPTAVTPKKSFGLYAAEHPVPPKTESSHSAKIVAVGTSSSGRPTVTLEGEELWELDAPDPLLAEGNSVLITRGTFGSFLLTTPTGRVHRVLRIH
jgi:hypothetical protein